MTDEMRQSISKDLEAMYPELFDDENAKVIEDSLITQAAMYCNQFKTSDDNLMVLIRLYTAHLLYKQQNADGNITSFKADVFQVGYADNSGDDNYLDQFNDMLSALGFSDWGVQFL